ncbi:MAG: polysaccharide biosynthesis tyrosine autokinase [Pseudomonadota bacterium]
MPNRSLDSNPMPRAERAVSIEDSSYDDVGIDFRELFAIVRRRAVMIATVTILVALAGLIYAMQLVPLYTSSASVLVDPRRTSVVDTKSVVSGIGKDSSAIDSEAELIKSASVARRVVQKLDLADEFGRDTQRAPTIMESLIRTARDILSRDPVERNFKGRNALVNDPVQRAAMVLRNNVSVSRKEWTYVISVSFTDADPLFAAQVANAFADEYLVDQLEAKYEATRRANAWLFGRLEELRTKVRESERAVETFKADNNIIAAKGTDLNDQQIAKLSEQLILARAETAQKRAKFKQLLEVTKKGGETNSFADRLQSQVIGTLRTKVTELRRVLADLRAKYGSRHPRVQSTRAQLADVTAQIRAEAKRVLAASRNDYNIALSREQSIESSLNDLKGEKTANSPASIRLRELEREAQADRQLFEAFLTRFKEVSQQQSLQTAESRIIERASVPKVPSKPKKRSIAGFSLILGLAIGCAFAFILEKLDSGFRTPDAVERALRVPVLASVPQPSEDLPLGWLARFLTRLLNALSLQRWRSSKRSLKKRAELARLAIDQPLTTFAEAIRSLRMEIRYLTADDQLNVLAVTSSLPQEGKSTLASNIAQQAAASGKKVLLVDMDLRRPALTPIYAPTAKAGVVELIRGTAEPRDVFVFDRNTGLYFVPAVRSLSASEASEVLSSEQTGAMLDWARQEFDLVIIDTAPLLPVVDGRAVVSHSDAVVMVVQWEKTDRAAVQAALSRTPGIEEKLAGVVLNNVLEDQARYYDYYNIGYRAAHTA